MTEMDLDAYLIHHIECGDLLATLATRISLVTQTIAQLENPEFEFYEELKDLEMSLLKLHRNYELHLKS